MAGNGRQMRCYRTGTLIGQGAPSSTREGKSFCPTTSQMPQAADEQRLRRITQVEVAAVARQHGFRLVACTCGRMPLTEGSVTPTHVVDRRCGPVCSGRGEDSAPSRHEIRAGFPRELLASLRCGDNSTALGGGVAQRPRHPQSRPALAGCVHARHLLLGRTISREIQSPARHRQAVASHPSPASTRTSPPLLSTRAFSCHQMESRRHIREAGLCYGRRPRRSLACGLRLQRPPDCPKTPWHTSDRSLTSR